jgi:ferritin-like metal-binding protein YciE
MPQARRRPASTKTTSKRNRTSARTTPPKVQIDTEDIGQLEAGRLLVVQQLEEAYAAEAAGMTTLRANIAMTPTGAYRTLLDRHLGQTEDQARRLSERLGELGASRSALAAGYAAAQTVVGQALAVSKTPLNLLRGKAGEEKLLKNAKDDVAIEAQEIATYDGLEATARAVGDVRTADLAASIREQEERQLAALRELLPRLAVATVRALVAGDRSYDAGTTGAAQGLRDAGEDVAERVEDARDEVAGRIDRVTGRAENAAERTASRGRAAAREVKDAVEGPETADLPIARYDELTAADIAARLSELSDEDVRTVEAYERRHRNRSTVLNRAKTTKD